MVTFLAVSVVAALGGALWWVRRRFAVVTVTGDSMLPTYRDGDRVVVRRARIVAVRTGDVVVVERPEGWAARPSRRVGHRGWMIKRAAAVPGEPVPREVRLADPVVPAGRLVVLGDNATASLDSRGFGYVPADRVLGIVVRRLASGGAG